MAVNNIKPEDDPIKTEEIRASVAEVFLRNVLDSFLVLTLRSFFMALIFACNTELLTTTWSLVLSQGHVHTANNNDSH